MDYFTKIPLLSSEQIHLDTKTKTKISYSLKWQILDRKSLPTLRKNCGFYDLEIVYIIFKLELASLSQRNKLASSCRYIKRYLLCNATWVLFLDWVKEIELECTLCIQLSLS